ncbi:hypothetical protein ApDm4_2690 [Acetobacter pomorum]|nr:hypothetical protein ApDm4_2690 [Acetobacter pomorum]
MSFTVFSWDAMPRCCIDYSETVFLVQKNLDVNVCRAEK